MVRAQAPLFRALAAAAIPGPLYHYTTAEGLEGILRHRTAWATAARYLNDAQEVRYAIDLARERLAWLEREAAGEARPRLIAHLARNLRRIDSDRPLVCVFSLSRRADDLSQWRAYCPESGGYSLGFMPDELRAIAEAQGCVLAPCVYDRSRQRALIEEAVDPVVAALPGRAPRPPEALARRCEPFVRRLLGRVERVAPLIKWPAYEAEEEWRIIWAARPATIDRLRYRPAESLFIPYVEIRLATEETSIPVEAIYVGPGPHQDIATASLRSFLRGVDVRVRAVKRSMIPLRTLATS
ncbi:MAG TPA: DUF2971 domain-containing protein [Gemmatimonadaceae bacterium]|nr:DUF2971 domain-containing protein [Gemmatimonadaceae bacterium]